jgi:hypothetical protein
MRQPGRTEPGSGVGGVGKLRSATLSESLLLTRFPPRRFALAVALFAFFPFAESMADESAGGAAARVLSRAALSVAVVAVCAELSALAVARSRAGVTASVQFAGIVAHRSGTMLARGDGVVSATGAFAAVSCALPAFSHEKAPSAVSAAAAVTEAARLFLRIMIDSGVERVLVGDRPRITTI